jgi:hypothetical protein
LDGLRNWFASFGASIRSIPEQHSNRRFSGNSSTSGGEKMPRLIPKEAFNRLDIADQPDEKIVEQLTLMSCKAAPYSKLLEQWHELRTKRVKILGTSLVDRMAIIKAAVSFSIIRQESLESQIDYVLQQTKEYLDEKKS